MGKTLKAGVARANITPSVGQDNMADYLRLVPARGVGNELYAKALVLDDGAERVAIVPTGQETITVGGSGGGADSAIVLKAAHMNNFFDLEIREIIAKPRQRGEAP